MTLQELDTQYQKEATKTLNVISDMLEPLGWSNYPSEYGFRKTSLLHEPVYELSCTRSSHEVKVRVELSDIEKRSPTGKGLQIGVGAYTSIGQVLGLATGIEGKQSLAQFFSTLPLAELVRAIDMSSREVAEDEFGNLYSRLTQDLHLDSPVPFHVVNNHAIGGAAFHPGLRILFVEPQALEEWGVSALQLEGLLAHEIGHYHDLGLATKTPHDAEYWADKWVVEHGLGRNLVEGLRHIETFKPTEWQGVSTFSHPSTPARIQRMEQLLES